MNVAIATATMVMLSACAPKTTVVWTQRGATRVHSDSADAFEVVVMAPIVRVMTSRGNVGRDIFAVRQTVALKVLEIVREREPGARLVDAAFGQGATGATHLLVPTIIEWTQMRTDAPIGVFTLDRNRITIQLRLIRVAPPPAPFCEVTFTNRARLTLNQPAARLLDGRFRATVLELLSCR
jgi:hypothetical protein